MITASALQGLMQQISGFGGFALAALALILSPVPVVWISFHRRRVSLARVGKDLFQTKGEHEARMRELQDRHAERMFELETARRQMLLEAELKQLTLQMERRPAEQELPLRRTPERPQIAAPKTAAA
jgi:hypothetical protein